MISIPKDDSMVGRLPGSKKE